MAGTKRKLTDAEQKVLQFNAKEAGMSVPEYMKYKLSPEGRKKEKERSAKAAESAKAYLEDSKKRREEFDKSETGKASQERRDKRQENLKAQKANEDLMAEYNPHHVNPSTGKLKTEEPGFWEKFFEGKNATHKNFPTITADQNELLKLYGKEIHNNLPGLLQSLNAPHKSDTSQQLEQMFSHMNNPILQGLLGGGPNQYKPQVLFPSQLGQQNNGIQDALSALLGAGLESGVPATWDYAQQNVPQWYNQAKESAPGQWFGNALSALGNRFRMPNNQQPI